MKRLVTSILCVVMCLVTCHAFAATPGEQNALISAKSYLSFMNFSYKGIYEQLEFDGYLPDECKYAADNCGADWYDQAAGSATTYLSFMSFSKKSLIEQLEFDGYTKEQAEYGAAVAYNENPRKPSDSKAIPVSIASSSPSVEPTPTEASKVDSKTEVWNSSTTFDLSALSYDELLSIQQSVTKEIMSRSEWREVEVPAGVWIIGQDIPAGVYSITPKGYVTFKFYENMETNYWDFYSLDSEKGLGRFELKEGMKIELTGPVVFAPPKGLGF